MKECGYKELIFVSEYITDFNASRSALQAGYSPNTGRGLIRRPAIAKAIAEAIEGRMVELRIDGGFVLQNLVKALQMDVKDVLNNDGSVKSVHDWPKTWRLMIESIDVSEHDNGQTVLKKLKWPSKMKLLEMIGKHVDVQAWNDKVDNQPEEAVPIKIEIITTDASKP